MFEESSLKNNVKPKGSDVDSIRQLLDEQEKNLLRRTSGEISGVELDRLDAEIDAQINAIRSGKNKLKNTEPQVDQFEEKFGHMSPTELLAENISGDMNRQRLLRLLSSQIGEITASDGYVYPKGYFIPIIAGLQGADDPNLQMVTSTGGLRNKVREILAIEDVKKKLAS